MPRNDDCRHPNCEGGPCKQLTAEELTPTEDDRETARELVAEGWVSISSKYRLVVRWKEPPPTPEQVVRPEQQGSYFGKRAMGSVSAAAADPRSAPRELLEERTLSHREFRAFKAITNAEWRELVRRVRG